VTGLTIDRWIALASSCGTLIAASFTAFSIRELRLQGAQQFQPRIRPTKITYKLRVYPEDLLDLEGQAAKRLPLINVGHGVATDLTVEWRAPIAQWIEKINTLSAQRGAGGSVSPVRSLVSNYAIKAKGWASSVCRRTKTRLLRA
jgi:hypothetical protein